MRELNWKIVRAEARFSMKYNVDKTKLLYNHGNYRRIEIFSGHNHSTVFIQR